MKTLTFTLDKKLAKFVSVACGSPVAVSLSKAREVEQQIIWAAQAKKISEDLMWSSQKAIMAARDVQVRGC